MEVIGAPPGLAELLNGARRKQPPKPFPMHSVAITTLREWQAGYDQAWKVGDIVTPRKGSKMKGVGQPHIVVEVKARAMGLPTADGEPSSPNFGALLDTRIMGFTPHGNVMCWWMESWELERYDPAMEHDPSYKEYRDENE